tara:strand:- start:354 stop:530 length:177 start_codon:yes stop_codon:yes gene_type:complete
MRPIALLGLTLCLASLLMSARVADGSVDTLVEKSIELIKAVDDPTNQAPDPAAHFSLD